METITDKFVVEFSPSQKALHVQPVTDMIIKNRQRFTGGPAADFYPLAICADEKSAARFCADLYKRFPNRFGSQTPTTPGAEVAGLPRRPHGRRAGQGLNSILRLGESWMLSRVPEEIRRPVRPGLFKRILTHITEGGKYEHPVRN